MANELSARAATASTVYFVVRQGALFFNKATSALEAYDASKWTSSYYIIAATEITGLGIFAASVPAGLPSGQYAVSAYHQASASPATTDTPIGDGQLPWDGSYERSLLDAAALLGMTEVVA